MSTISAGDAHARKYLRARHTLAVVFNRGRLGPKSQADILGESGAALPDSAAAGTVERTMNCE